MMERIKAFFAKPGHSYFFLGGLWGLAAIPCVCPACLVGPAAVAGRGVLEHIPFWKKKTG
ncbi:MAG: hypothetical protein QW568_01075 [Candidatus Anstonellaceae archaeon]